LAAHASAHPKESALAKLALGIGAYEQGDWTVATEALRALPGLPPRLADYAAYYRAAAKVESKQFEGVAEALAAVQQMPVLSPFGGRARILEGRALIPSNPADAVRTLRDHYPELPQPLGDLALAEAYQAAGDPTRAAEFFQRVYYLYPGGDAAAKSGGALAALQQTLGSVYPPPSAEQMLRRADRLLEMRDFLAAREEYRKLTGQLTGAGRDRALVKMGFTDIGRGQWSAALAYLRALPLTESDAEAERLYGVVEAARHLRTDDEMMAAVEQLRYRYPKSPWRAKALVSAGNRFLLVNEPDRYIPLYRMLYENFPADAQAPSCHWKVAFAAYMKDDPAAEDFLREHVRQYPWHVTAAGAMYFLGRRAEAVGDSASARLWYSRITEVFANQYYGMLARDRLRQVKGGGTAEKTAQLLAGVSFPLRKAPALEATPAMAARLARARWLRIAGLGDLADAEMRFGARVDGQPWVAAVEIADSAENSFLALRAMKSLATDYLNLPLESAPRKVWDHLFPLPWRAELVRNASERNLDPYVMAGLIRQESEFNPKAISRAKAYGLTQVRPPTGRMFARSSGVKRLSNSMLFQPATNLKLGAAILRSMFDKNGGKWEPTLAAYNAGPNRVVQWAAWANYREPAEFVESIPITETRDYVQAVLRNADIYRRLYAAGGSALIAAKAN
jgi:soluble lytic murein transglycosylase